ncbi:hypothetical protein JTM05_41360, partial [Pseudomonas aeruginosa]|nr:hypothetical protein [Pseudomonas aeruginosa]
MQLQLMQKINIDLVTGILQCLRNILVNVGKLGQIRNQNTLLIADLCDTNQAVETIVGTPDSSSKQLRVV